MNLFPPVAAAIVAHPDDVEFMMAGTLLLLKQAGVQIHIWNLANGCHGTVRHTKREMADIRWNEAQAAAKLGGAQAHAPLFDDLAVFYDAQSLARVSAGLRLIQPTIILTHAREDYMEDHQNTSRLVVTAAFSRAIPNYETIPLRPGYDKPVAIYHALPHGLAGPTNERPTASHFINIESSFALKRDMLAQHRSQQEWLDASQGMNSYLDAMQRASAEMGKLSRRFVLAEGFSKHSHVGFGPAEWDPLLSLLNDNVFIPNKS